MTKHEPRDSTTTMTDQASESEYDRLLEESGRLAIAEGINSVELAEMDAINQMRIVAEAIASDDYIFHTSS